MEHEISPVSLVEQYRRERRIIPFVSDYLPDERTLAKDARVSYYRQLRQELGVHTVRTEFRMRHMMNVDGSFNDPVVASCKSALAAMKEAGLDPPIVYLFSPPKWFIELAKKDPQLFRERFRSYAMKVRQVYEEAKFQPSYIQVMSEVNLSFHTPLSLERLTELINIARSVFRPEDGGPKLMTTVQVGDTIATKDWKEFVVKLMGSAGHALDGLGFDYYPGSYEYPAGVPIIGKKPFEAFGGTTPYSWLSEQKQSGILKDKEIIIAEVGVPGLTRESKLQRYGYDRIIQSLDHFLLTQERQGIKGDELFRAVGFFAGAEFPNVYTMVPGGIDFHPWTLIRKTKEGAWAPTNAGRRLKHLIHTRLYPPKS